MCLLIQIRTPPKLHATAKHSPGRESQDAQSHGMVRYYYQIVKWSLHITIVCLSIFGLLSATDIAQAGPLRGFFTVLRSAIPHPEQRHRRPHQSTHNDNKTPSNDVSNSEPSGSPVSAPPGEHNANAATTPPPPKQQEKSDRPYGIPVPGKQGFVTSPFSRDAGYIDVRGFPPGTAVKDPYTGKDFLTP